jgi:hypothetical protein
MARRRNPGLLALLVLTAVGLFSPLSPVKTSSAAEGSPLLSSDGTMYLQVRGTADREPGGPPDRFVYVLDVYDMNNRTVGKVRHDVKFTSPSTLDLVSTFSLPDGELVNHGVEAIGPDASKQGFYLIGVHSDTDTVQGDKSTGAYAGRTGRLRMSGWHDANKFPQTVTLNDFYEIRLNP